MPARRPFVTRGGTGRPRPEARGLRLRGMRHDHASHCTQLAPARPCVAHAVLRCTAGTLRVSSRAWSTAAEASRLAARAFALSRCVRARHCSVQRRLHTRLLTRCVSVFRRAARSESSRTLTLVSHIFAIDFTVTFTLPHTGSLGMLRKKFRPLGWGCYVTRGWGLLRNIPSLLGWVLVA
jgi:hypothetical protein